MAVSFVLLQCKDLINKGYLLEVFIMRLFNPTLSIYILKKAQSNFFCVLFNISSHTSDFN